MKFFARIAELFSNKKYILTLLEGLGQTLYISLCALLIGLVLGMIVAVVKIAAARNKNLKVFEVVCDIYVMVIRGTPVALQLFIMAYAIFAIRGFPLAVTAILTFGINSGAYVSENIRAGIQSVDIGQTEAGRALGLSFTSTMLKVVVPQAVKNVIPSIGNEMISLLKETSIVSMVGLVDLTFSAKIIGSGQNMANYLVPMCVAALFYLVLVYGMTILLKTIEKKLSQSDRKVSVKKKKLN